MPKNVAAGHRAHDEGNVCIISRAASTQKLESMMTTNNEVMLCNAHRLLWQCGTVHQKGYKLAEYIVQRSQLPQIDTALTKWAPRIRLARASVSPDYSTGEDCALFIEITC